MLLVLLLFLGSLFATPRLFAPTDKPCVFYKGYKPLANGDIGLLFYNSCWMPMWVNVCVPDKRGKPYLVQSIRAVPRNGFFDLGLDLYREPAVIYYTYDPMNASIPAPCAIPEK